MSKNAIHTYRCAKQELDQAKEWGSMFGKPFHGGAGGHGRLVKLKLAYGGESPTIYFQESHGSKNYHECPASLRAHLETAISNRFYTLLGEALQLQAEELKALAAEAAKEHAELMVAAGLPTPE